MTYEYFINLDERGEFYADVRNPSGETIWELKSDAETGEIWMLEDGFMENIDDLSGLHSYLLDGGLIKIEDDLVKGV